MSVLSISLLGPFQARLDTQPMPEFRTRKVQALLIYLTAEPEKHLRETLMDLMWPGMPSRSARHNLRQVLYYLRSAVPELHSKSDEDDHEVPFLITNRQMIRINPDALVKVDVARFEELLNEVQAHEHINVISCPTCLTSLEKAVELYRGDFLVDFYLDDSNPFEEWAQVMREAYRRKVLDALEVLTAAASRQREFPKAQALAKRQLEIDNLRESAYRQLMEILALSGHREEALSVYEKCRRLLAEELGMEPAKRTAEIAEKIMAGDLSFDTPLAKGVRGYELKEEIGVGAYGVIHRAFQSTVSREVAVKIIRRKFANDPEFIRRFETEAQTVARLEHPYIVPLYDYWRDPDGAYLVMRYLKGGNLLSALESGPWDVAPTVRMLDQLAAALATAHRQGVVHRDIKPANILLDESGNAYLSDFGIAKDMASERELTAEGNVVGTLDYISPEQIRNQPVSPQTDIYSLGAVLYETLTGEKPFPDATPANLIYRHLNDPVPLVTTSQPNTPRQIDTIIQRATAKNPAERYADVREMAEAFRQSVASRTVPISVTVPEAFPAVTEVYNPYKGLHAFQEADADDFFGREALVQQFVDRLADSRLLALVGPSGSGKSSAVKAGLIPALREGALPGSEKWFVAEMVPGTHPLEELEMALWPIAVDPPPSLVEPMERDNRGLLRTVRRILPNETPHEDGSQLLLIVDQFEELFILVDDEDRRSFFIESLLQAIAAPRSPLRVVLTLRADFYDRPLAYETLGRLLKQNTEVILPLTSEELTWAMREPARRVGVGLEEGLAEAIVADVADQPGALPLLQFALTELFERRHESLMTQDAYREVGGVLGALGRRAETIYADLDEPGQELVRQLFLRLVTLGEGVEDTRRRVPRAELESLAGQRTEAGDDSLPAEASAQLHLNEIIDAFGRARLLTFDHDPLTRQPTVEVAHEALLRDWRRLRRWLDDSRDDIRQERALLRSAEEWVQHDREESFLLRGLRLEMVESWQETSSLIETTLGHEFISQSLLHRDRQRHAETERRERELGLERRSRTLLRGLLAVFVLATLVSLGLVLLTLNQRQSALNIAADAQNVALVAGSQAAFANDDSDTALALAWKAVELHPDSAIAQAQLSEVAYAPGTVRVLTGNEAGGSRLAISPDDKTIFVGGEGTVILWELASGRILWERQAHELWVQDVAFSADGRLVAATFDDRIMLWQTADGQLIHQIESNDVRQQIAFDPNGRHFATIGTEEENRIKLWDISSGEAIRELDGASNVADIAYAEDGSRILLANGDGPLTLVDVQTGQVIYEVQEELGISAGLLSQIAISPDGAIVAGAFSNAGLVVWDFQTGNALNSFRYDGGVFSLAFHPQDGTLLIGGAGMIRTLNLETGEILRTNTGHSGAIVDLALTADGRRAVTTAIDETIRLWDLWNGQIVRRYAEPGSLLFEVALSPDGRSVLIGSTDGTATLRDVETGTVIHQFATDQPIMAVTFSPDGRTALIGAGYRLAQKVESGHVILLDVETGEEIRRFEGQPYAVYDVEFSPDGRLAASSGNGAMAILWDVKTGEEIRRFEDYWIDNIWPIESYWDIEFGPDGQQLFASHASGPIIAWDVEDGEMLRELVGHNGAGATGIAFSRDGRRLVSGGWDSQAIVWDIPSGDILHRFDNHAGPVGQVRFSPDETLLLGGSVDGSSSLWHVETGEVIRRYGGGFVISPNFSADGRHALAGLHDGAVELWRIDSTLDELLTWTQNNRYVPELTCEQRELYMVEPFCEPGEG